MSLQTAVIKEIRKCRSFVASQKQNSEEGIPVLHYQATLKNFDELIEEIEKIFRNEVIK